MHSLRAYQIRSSRHVLFVNNYRLAI